MARKQRIWYPGAMYHITCRGNRKWPIFHDEADYNMYLFLLIETQKRYPFLLHSYCLMTNHIHLLIETKTTPISRIMQFLTTRYAKYYNERYHYVGHLFQGRYYSGLITSSSYFMDASKYIHLNPYDAGMVASPEDYCWSSLFSYLFHTFNPNITPSFLYSHLPFPEALYYHIFIQSEKSWLKQSFGLR
ncbi:transposase [Alkalihalobacterium bogoriense]|uniref:transposase n=1 Tax=Alkalihalobacterium bogoriense TaxID=246272 RepID=UPI00047AD79C|nr:transposase [Alkalihalobacterium bogoriense]